MAERSRIARVSEWAGIGLFCLLLTLPAADHVLGLDATPAREFRSLRTWQSVPEAMPDPTAVSEALREWSADQFGFRNALVRAYSYGSVLGLGASSTESVALGREGWAFLATPDARDSMLARSPLDGFSLGVVVRRFKANRDWLEKRGIQYVVAVVPGKPSVYPEKLPPGVDPMGRLPNLYRVQRALAKAGIDVVDLRRHLRPLAADEIYDPLGTHWNALGAYHGYRALVDPVAARHPEVRPLELDAFRWTREPGGDQELARMLGLDGILRADTWKAEPLDPVPVLDDEGEPFEGDLISNGARISAAQGVPGPRVLLVVDSFGNQLAPFFALTFPEVTYAWPPQIQPAPKFWQMAEQVGPEVVIEVIAERRLETLRFSSR